MTIFDVLLIAVLFVSVSIAVVAIALLQTIKLINKELDSMGVLFTQIQSSFDQYSLRLNEIHNDLYDARIAIEKIAFELGNMKSND